MFIALDPNAFAPGFDDRLQTYIDEMRSLEPVSGNTSHSNSMMASLCLSL